MNVSIAEARKTIIEVTCDLAREAANDPNLSQTHGSTGIENVLESVRVLLVSYEALAMVGKNLQRLNTVISGFEAREVDHYRLAKHYERTLISLYGPKERT